ncbi:type VII secretion protein EsxR [Nocardia sp. AG03]|uniref:WXG100 family type VII secretion target n=1 Tax=Nocardia sp. AG03 TaxID=3025312 RepID=UPI00241885DB|nr:type VII secretion protein EsxR [Nocardia sp. AG03]
MTILYDPAAMNELFSDLQTYGGKMQGEISELETAATNFRANLQGDNAHQSFDAAHKSVTEELKDTLTRLDRLAGQVESALNRALEADGKVGDGFADF